MARSGFSDKAYLGLPWIISLILVIIPVTNIVLGIITRVARGHLLGAILNFFLMPLFYVVDIITFILGADITFLA